MSVEIAKIVLEKSAVLRIEESLIALSLDRGCMHRSKALFSIVVKCLLFSIATVGLAPTWGCGGSVPSQIASDDGEANAKTQAAFASMKAARTKKRLPDVPVRNKLQAQPRDR
jgi:hypothetical protein